MNDAFVAVERALSAIQQGRMVILMDDEDRENEGDLVMAAEHIDADSINFMTRFGRGLICLPMAEALIDKLRLPMMTNNNRSAFGTGFTVSIEAAKNIATGISAKDRAHTVQVAISETSGPDDIVVPGHIFPLRAKSGGVLERLGQTEGSVDLVRIAGCKPAAVICEILNEDGTMSRRDDLQIFSKKHDIPILTVRDIIAYRIYTERLVFEAARTKIPLHGLGEFSMVVFENSLDKAEHFALVNEKFSNSNVEPPLVRIHSECITGDVFRSCKCDCGLQLQQSMHKIAKEGGILIYLRQEGRGIGLANKIKAYALQEQGYDTVEANLKLGLPVDCREYACAYQILKYMGISKVRIMTNNPLKIKTLVDYGIEVVERLPLVVPATETNREYLSTKKSKLGHFLVETAECE